MTTMFRFSIVVVLGLAGGMFAVQAGEKKGADADFVRKASESDLVEMELGKLASKQASNSRVREFGSKMANGHSKTTDELAAIGKKNGFTLAKEQTKQHKDMCEKLSKMSGAEFDRQFITGQVKAHQEAVKLFSDEAKNGQNADVRAFAAKALPTIQEHLRMAEEISRTLDKSK
jgi:putative membrane protein